MTLDDRTPYNCEQAHALTYACERAYLLAAGKPGASFFVELDNRAGVHVEGFCRVTIGRHQSMTTIERAALWFEPAEWTTIAAGIATMRVIERMPHLLSPACGLGVTPLEDRAEWAVQR